MTSVSSSRLGRTYLAISAMLMAGTAFGATIGGGGDAREVELSKSYDFAADPASTASTYIVARGTPKKVSRVALASVCIGVVDGRSVGGKSGSYSASAASPFPGNIDPQRLAAVAEAYSNQLVADLKAGGFEVLSHEELKVLPSYSKLAEKMTTEPYEFVDPYELGKGTWANNRVQVISPAGRPMLKDCRSLTPGTMLGFVRASSQKDLDGITLMVANVTLDFAKAKAAGGFFRGAKADFDYGQYIAPGIGATNFFFANKNGGGTNLWLKQAIVAADNPFAEGDKSRKKLDVKLDNEYNPNSGITATSSQTTAVSADMELWYSNASNQLKALSGMLVQALKASK